MATEAEVRAMMADFKANTEGVDWEKYEVYAVQNMETGEVEKLGYAERSRIMSVGPTPEVGR